MKGVSCGICSLRPGPDGFLWSVISPWGRVRLPSSCCHDAIRTLMAQPNLSRAARPGRGKPWAVYGNDLDTQPEVFAVMLGRVLPLM